MQKLEAVNQQIWVRTPVMGQSRNLTFLITLERGTHERRTAGAAIHKYHRRNRLVACEERRVGDCPETCHSQFAKPSGNPGAHYSAPFSSSQSRNFFKRSFRRVPRGIRCSGGKNFWMARSSTSLCNLISSQSRESGFKFLAALSRVMLAPLGVAFCIWMREASSVGTRSQMTFVFLSYPLQGQQRAIVSKEQALPTGFA